MKEVQIVSDMAPPRRIGIIIVAITFGVFGMWSLIAPLESAALAPGIVMVKGSRKNIEHFEGGIVAELPVRDGDTVQQGDLLIRLDDTQARAQLEISRGQFYAVKAREARLQAERDNAEWVDYPALIADSQDPRAQDAVQSQNQVFSASRNARLGEIEVLQQKIDQLGEQIKGTRALKLGKEKLVTSYAEEVKDFTELLQEGFADKQRLRELERSLARTEGEAAELVSSIARLKIQVGETRLQILQLEKEFHTAVVAELSKTQTETYDLEERIRAAADRADRTEIRSPASGVVVGMAVTTIGEVVSPGESLMYVVPQSAELIVEAQVNPVDIDRVHGGQSADIRFSAFKSATTPVIDGIVVSISADALTNEQLGTSYYLARVELTPEGVEMLAGLTLVPGMPAEVLINTGSRTLFQYLTQPIRNAFARSLIED
ncbi:MAG: HlyD family type I secretion periplasmic adaptor subunit [Gammaproteobacteria bacterium]|nr:HlyD family type I secretion periplasmic adaptor subunit [Gammaproteobacteria bacterium]